MAKQGELLEACLGRLRPPLLPLIDLKSESDLLSWSPGSLSSGIHCLVCFFPDLGFLHLRF